jgi:hypothetical protein
LGMTLTSDPTPNPPVPVEADSYWQHVLLDGRGWASEHQALLALVFGEFDRTGSWPKQEQLKRELARSGRDFRLLEATTDMPRVLGWVDWSSGEIVLKPLGLSAVGEARFLLDQFIAALRIAVDSYLSEDPAPKVMSGELQAALELDEMSLRKLGKILLNERLWLGSTSDETGALVEAMVSDRVLEFADVAAIDDYLEVSTRIAYPRSRVVPTGLPSRFEDDFAAYTAQNTPRTGVDAISTRSRPDLHQRSRRPSNAILRQVSRRKRFSPHTVRSAIWSASGQACARWTDRTSTERP